MPKLSIVILNHNTRELLKQTLDSIPSRKDIEIIVVDNASSDDSVAMIKREYKKIKLIENPDNSGFAAGNNLGLKQAKGDYLLLLNSDTKIIGKALDKLLEYAGDNPKVGILTPRLELTTGDLDPASHRGFPTISNSLFYFSGLSKLFPASPIFADYHQTYKDLDKPHPVDAVSGAAMLIKRQVVEDIGYLDERYFMYAEDIDFCYRAKQAGWQIHFVPSAKVIHYKGQSGTLSLDQTTRSRTRKHFYHTMKQFYDKHYAPTKPAPVNWLVHLSIDLVAKLRG